MFVILSSCSLTVSLHYENSAETSLTQLSCRLDKCVAFYLHVDYRNWYPKLFTGLSTLCHTIVNVDVCRNVILIFNYHQETCLMLRPFGCTSLLP